MRKSLPFTVTLLLTEVSEAYCTPIRERKGRDQKSNLVVSTESGRGGLGSGLIDKLSSEFHGVLDLVERGSADGIVSAVVRGSNLEVGFTVSELSGIGHGSILVGTVIVAGGIVDSDSGSKVVEAGNEGSLTHDGVIFGVIRNNDGGLESEGIVAELEGSLDIVGASPLGPSYRELGTIDSQVPECGTKRVFIGGREFAIQLQVLRSVQELGLDNSDNTLLVTLDSANGGGGDSL